LKPTLIIVLAAALVWALVGVGAGLGLGGTSGSGTALSPERLYRLNAPGVIAISSTHTHEAPATPFTRATKEGMAALGSGFVIDKQGDILTSDHVIQGSTSIRVGFSSGAWYPAHVVGTDPSSDVAVVRVRAPGSALRPLRFDNSSAIAVGDPVYAIGNPFGLDRTMTAGIVSATGKDIRAPDGATIPNAIQTDAPINHGNSGGPLLDRFGRVIGIDAQVESGSVDDNAGVGGVAVPGNTARTVAAELIRRRRDPHA
jgi:S1-C subfamily serine protease